MSTQRSVTFVVPNAGGAGILENNFMASPCLRDNHAHQILVQKDFPSAGKAYNHAIDNSENDLLIFAHQDMIFPEAWLSQLQHALDYLDDSDPRWGVLGCYGVTRDGGGRGFVYSPGGVMGSPFECPAPVQTLDEIVLIIRKSSGLRFDDRLPHFHLFGADICLRAARLGMKCYAISSFCIHNAHHYVVLPKEFYECCRHLKRVWKDYLPIQTTCIRITKFNIPLYIRRLRETRVRYTRHKGFLQPRADDVPQLLREVEALLHSSSASGSY